MVGTKSESGLDLIKAISNSIIVLIHVCNITTILSKKHLRRNGMCCMLINLSLSDNLTLLFYSLKIEHHLRHFLISVNYTSSLLSTLGISLDKYLSVQYSLRYHSIVTQNKVAISIGIVWMASIIFAAVCNTSGNQINVMY